MFFKRNKKSLTILLIDDEQDILDVIGNHLENEYAYNTIRFSKINAALKWFKNNHNSIDVIVADYKIPRSENAAYLKRFHKIKKKPVLIITGYPNSKLTNHELWDKYVIKPCFKGLNIHIESIL